MPVVYGVVTDVTLPGGWHFFEKLSSGQTVKIEGGSYQDLEDKVLKFRLRQIDLVEPNTSTVEKVKEDIRAYICANFPRSCIKPAPGSVESIPRAQAPVSFVPPIERISSWFRSLSYRSIEYVDASESNRRANLCVHCPNNIKWQVSCVPCNHEATRQAFILQAGKQVQNERHLEMCRSFGHYLPTAVWLKDTHSEAQHPPPSFCWKSA